MPAAATRCDRPITPASPGIVRDSVATVVRLAAGLAVAQLAEQISRGNPRLVLALDAAATTGFRARGGLSVLRRRGDPRVGRVLLDSRVLARLRGVSLLAVRLLAVSLLAPGAMADKITRVGAAFGSTAGGIGVIVPWLKDPVPSPM